MSTHAEDIAEKPTEEAPLEELNVDAQGAPTEAAASTNLSTSEATGEAIAENKETAGANIAAEALLPKIDTHVAEAEVKVINEEATAAENAQTKLAGTDAAVTGPHIPTEGLGEHPIEVIKKDTFETQDVKALRHNPTSGTAAAEVTKNRKIRLHWRLPKILGGHKQ